MATAAVTRCQAATAGTATASKRAAAPLAAPRCNPLRTAAAQRSSAPRGLVAVQAVAAPPAPAAAAARPKAIVDQDKANQKPTCIITGAWERCTARAGADGGLKALHKARCVCLPIARSRRPRPHPAPRSSQARRRAWA